jgi:hypothetical protein
MPDTISTIIGRGSRYMVQLMMLFKEHPAHSQGWLARSETTPQTRRHRWPTRRTLVRSVLVGFVALLTRLVSPLTRRWLASALANICILGGILGAPVVSVVAWVGLALPTQHLLHQMAPMLVTGSLIWFGVAIACAHAFRLGHPDRHDA